MSQQSACRKAARLLVLMLGLLLPALLLPIVAAADEPTLAAATPPPSAPAPPRVQPPLSAAAALAGLKVVYVVGAMDGVDGPVTAEYVRWGRADAAGMRALGMTVVEFYPPNNLWPDITAAAVDAAVLVYSGHGVSWGGDPPTVGGFNLLPGVPVHPDQIRTELRMKPGAIVILNHACFSTGMSTTDAGAITTEEAQRRVAQYSLPFLDTGFSGYFANFYFGFPLDLLTYIARGMSHGQAFAAYHDYGAGSVERYRHPQHPGYAMWLDKDDWGGIKYTYAFAGDENAMLGEVVGSAKMSLDPETLWVRAVPGAGGLEFGVTVSVSNGIDAAWSAAIDGAPLPWVRLEADAGVAGQGLRLLFTVPGALGDYRALVRIRTGDSRVENQEALLPVLLEVVEDSPFRLLVAGVWKQ